MKKKKRSENLINKKVTQIITFTTNLSFYSFYSFFVARCPPFCRQKEEKKKGEEGGGGKGG